ncbi:MAG: DNA methyltransferase [Burkholderiales bacterium]
MSTNLARILDPGCKKNQLTRDLFDEILDSAAITTDRLQIGQSKVLRLTGEFWTSGQRQASSLHEISYRACFKPQLPRYFITRFTNDEDLVYDPFSGRGTTAVEAGLMGRRVVANDVNPLSRILTEPRLDPPMTNAVAERLAHIRYREKLAADLDLSMFYHRDTESEIVALKQYLAERKANGEEDGIDRWIRMVATNRLTGHSPGFFSVYTFPPNQAVTAESQRKINEKRKQTPEYRDTKSIILKKTRSLLSKLAEPDRANLRKIAGSAQFLTGDARFTRGIANESVQLTVTSPPFLDIVGYASDNWLRCWFNDIDVEAVAKTITMAKTIEAWSLVMGGVFKELYRVTKPGGWVAFEVGEIRNATLRLEEYVVPLGIQVGFSCEAILINSQIFTKTSNLWGVKNNKAGTNSNRIVVFRR